MTPDDLQEVAAKVGMVKTPQGQIKPLWLASDAQLMAFAAEINKNIKQSASEYVVQAIKKAVEYEREECAKIASVAGITDRDIARQIRERGQE